MLNVIAAVLFVIGVGSLMAGIVVYFAGIEQAEKEGIIDHTNWSDKDEKEGA